MLSDSRVEANIPAGDIDRAQGVLRGQAGADAVASSSRRTCCTRRQRHGVQHLPDPVRGQAGHTIAQFHVQDVEEEVADLKAKGVTFEVYDDMPGVEWRGEVAVMPEMGKAAWFKDSEGNILCLDEPAAGF